MYYVNLESITVVAEYILPTILAIAVRLLAVPGAKDFLRRAAVPIATMSEEEEEKEVSEQSV